MTKPMLISLSVLSALTFSSCGKSSDTKNTTVTTAQTTGRKSNTKPSGPVNGAPTPSSPNGSVGSAQPVGEISTPVDQSVNPSQPISENGITIIEQTDKNGQPIVDGKNIESGSNGPAVQSQPQISAAADLKFDEDQAVKTGGRAGDLNYTSASRDGLMTEFKLKSKTVSANQQIMNQKLASAITAAKLRRAGNGELNLDLAIIEPDQKVHSYSMRAVVDGNKMKLTAINSGGDLEFQGGFLKCLDTDGGCQNAYAKIKLSGAYTRIIFRTSFADHHFVIYANPSDQNSNFDLWNSYILNKINGAQTSQKLSNVAVSSFEIVNGKSAMGVLLSAADQDAVGLSLGLLAPDQGTKLLAPVAKHSDISKSYDLKLPPSSGQKLSQALMDAKLVANNGLGQLKLMFSFSENPQGSKIWMNLSSVEKSTMTVSDVQKFEATVKNF